MKPLHAGKLNTRVIFENPNLIKDSAGSQVPGTPTQYPDWACIESSTGTFGARREFVAASQEWGESVKLVRFRYRKVLVDMDTTWRAKIGDVWYNVLRPVDDVDNRHREMNVIVGLVR